MAERKKSEDGVRETEAYLDPADEGAAQAQEGRSGGTPARQVASRDEEKRAEQDDPGATRVRKSDEEGA